MSFLCFLYVISCLASLIFFLQQQYFDLPTVWRHTVHFFMPKIILSARQLSFLLNFMHSYPTQQFLYPLDPNNYRAVQNNQQFNQLLKRQQIRREVTFQVTITNSNGQDTMRFRCKQCEAYFEYTRNKKNEDYTIRSYKHEHNHVMRQTHNIHQSIVEKIQRYLQQDDRPNKQDLLRQISTSYRITQKEVQQLFSQAAQRKRRNTLLYDGREIDQLIRKLKSEHYTVMADFVMSKLDRQTRNITKSIVVVNQIMNSNTRRYGQCIYVALDSVHQINRWSVGAFLGMGRHMELILLGLFLLKTVDTEHLTGLFRIFFSSLVGISSDKQLITKTIVTTGQHYFDQTLAQLKKEGLMQPVHLYDFAIYIDKLHSNTSRFKKMYRDLVYEPQKQKFNQKLTEIYRGENFSQIDLDLEELIKVSDKICLSQIPVTPIGPYRKLKGKTSQYKDFSIIRQYYKIFLDSQSLQVKNLTTRFQKLLTVLLVPFTGEIAHHNRLMVVIPALQQVRKSVSIKVMENIQKKCLAILSLRVQDLGQGFKVFDGRFTQVRIFEQGGIWFCQCQQSRKSLLPCVHQIAVCIKNGFSIMKQIARRWTNLDQKQQQQRKRKLQAAKCRWKKKTLSQFLT